MVASCGTSIACRTWLNHSPLLRIRLEITFAYEPCTGSALYAFSPVDSNGLSTALFVIPATIQHSARIKLEPPTVANTTRIRHAEGWHA